MADTTKALVRARVLHRKVSIEHPQFAPVVFDEACATEGENHRLILQGFEAAFDHDGRTQVTC